MTTFKHQDIMSKIKYNMDDTELKSLFGKRVREIRKNRKLTQEQLAELIGMDTHHLCKMENGSHFPKVSNLSKLADVFGIEVKDLFSFDKSTTPANVLQNKIILNLNQLNEKELIIVDKFITSIIDLKQ